MKASWKGLAHVFQKDFGLASPLPRLCPLPAMPSSTHPTLHGSFSQAFPAWLALLYFSFLYVFLVCVTTTRLFVCESWVPVRFQS